MTFRFPNRWDAIGDAIKEAIDPVTAVTEERAVNLLEENNRAVEDAFDDMPAPYTPPTATEDVFTGTSTATTTGLTGELYGLLALYDSDQNTLPMEVDITVNSNVIARNRIEASSAGGVVSVAAFFILGAFQAVATGQVIGGSAGAGESITLTAFRILD